MMTAGSHELALTIINDGAGYQRRKNAGARMVNGAPSAAVIRGTAAEWVDIARDGARKYERQFGTRWAS